MQRFLIALLLVVIIVAGAFEWMAAKFSGPGPAAHKGSETVVLIPAHLGLSGIAQKLSDADVVAQPLIFQLGVRLRGMTGTLKAGEYAIPSRASMYDIMAILIAGKSIQHKVTAAEGLTSDMIYKLVQADPVLTGDAGAEPDEGTLLPETYLYTRGTTRAQILARMRAAQAKLLAELWPQRAQNLPIKTQQQALILASVVEKETALPEERRHIAAVFENRLNLGMKLQSDPTIIYGITKGYPLGRRIKESEIAAVTPYNTYVIPGLPATPICNPGKDSIAAVLNPETSKDLYFVANGTGGHTFSADVADQNKNVALWRKIEQTQQANQPIPAHK
jgi:UPF0755 protein